MKKARLQPKRWSIPTIALVLLLGSGLLAGCGSLANTPAEFEEVTRASTLPDVSGLAWMGGDRFLAVHDAKVPEEAGLPRVSVLELPTGIDGVLWQVQEIEFPEEQSNDFESIARIPGTMNVLLVESTEEQDEKPFSRRIFLARFTLHGVEITDVVKWPVETRNVEGTAVAKVGGQLIFLYAERAQGEDTTEIHFAKLQLDPLVLESAGTFSSPGPIGDKARPVTAMDVDSEGVVYVASAEDPGDDNGPFRSAVYAIGQVVEEGSRAQVALYDEPLQLALLDGLKVESLAVRELPGQQPELYVGLDDENYGGMVRPLPHPSATTSE